MPKVESRRKPSLLRPPPEWPGEVWKAYQFPQDEMTHAGFLVTVRGDIDRPIAYVPILRVYTDSPEAGAEALSCALSVAMDIAKRPAHATEHAGYAGRILVGSELAEAIHEDRIVCKSMDPSDGTYDPCPLIPERFARMLRVLVNADDADEVTISTTGKPTWKVSGLDSDEPTFEKIE